MLRPRRIRVFAEAFTMMRASSGRIVWISLAVDVVGAAANAAMLVIAGRILGFLAVGTNWDQVTPWLIAAAIVLAITSVASSLHADLISLGAEHTEAHAVDQVVRAAAEVPFESFDRPQFYDRFRRAYEGGSEHAFGIVYNALTLARTALDMVAIIVVLAFVAPVLILIGIASYVPMVIAAVLNNRDRYDFSWEETEADRRRSYIETLLSDRQPAKEVRIYRTQHTLLSQYRDLWDRRLVHLARVVRGTALRSALGYLVSSFVVTGALAVVVWLTIRGDISIEQAGVGVLGVRQLSTAVTRSSNNLEALHGGAQFLGDHREFCLAASKLVEHGNDEVALTRIDEIRLDNVSFRYPGSSDDTLNDVSLRIRSGELTAIVGANGSGKTTLLMVLAAMYPPTSGALQWNNTNVAELGPEQRSKYLSVLFQDYVHYHFTVEDNVVMGAEANGDLDHSLAASGAADFVDQLAEGIATPLGKDFHEGAELSIGQWQRLALARAIYRDAPVLLLDEPASALDPEAEVGLVEQLRASRAGRCTVLISHRFASVRQADNIIVLDEGRVIEQGSHAELVELGGAYNALYRAQVSAMIGDEEIRP